MGAAKKNVKLVPLQADLVEQLYSMSASLGIPFKALLHNMVEKGIRLALLNNGALDQIEREYYVQKTFSRIGFIMIPLPLFSSLLEKIDDSSYEELLKDALENGRQIGTLLSLDSNMNDSDKITNLLKALFPESPQIKVSQQGKNLKIAMIIHGRSKRLIELPLAVLRGALSSMGYDELKAEVTPGLVLASYRKIK